MKRTILATLLLVLVPCLAVAQKPEDSWQNLSQLRAGQKIEVVDMNLKSLKGAFVSFTEEAISLRVNGDDVLVEKAKVLRVTDRTTARRGRNALLGLAIGLGTGFAVGAALDSSELSGGAQGAMKAGLTPLGGAVGAAIGAMKPSGARTIYRAPKR